MREVCRGRRALVAFAVLAMVVPAAASAGAETERGAAVDGAAWVQRALDLQYELGSDVGFRNAPWLGTHNSFNSTAEMGQTISARDSNQRITIVDQLDVGMRSIELDLHRFPSAQGGGIAPVVCHARPGSEGHAGCTAEKPLGPVLDAIAAWLAEHPDQVVMIYVNDYLDNAEGYDQAAAIFDEKLGTRLYRPAPAGGSCQELPLSLTRNEIRDDGKQVFVVSDCAPGAGWPSTIFTWEEHEEGQPRDFTDFPQCGQDYTREQYDQTLIRYYEDSTSLSDATGDPGRIDTETTARMTRCGVDLIHFDQLEYADPRLEGAIWSWAPNEPGKGSCSVQRVGENVPFGRWRSRECKGKRRAACRTKRGNWEPTSGRVEFAEAKAACREQKSRFAVPRTGYEAQLLRLAMESAEVRGVWLGQERQGQDWVALDRR